MWRTRHGHGVIGRCGSSAGAGTPVPATSANGPPSVPRARRKCRPTGRCPGRGELAGAGMTGARRRGRDDYAPTGVEVDPHRRARVGCARCARQVDGPRFAAQGPDWQPGCGLAQDPDSKPVGDAHPIRRANDRHRSSRRAHPGPRVRRVSCRVGRTVLFPARVESTPVTPVVVTAALSTTGRAWARCAGARRRRLASGRSPGRRVLGSSGSTAVCGVACLSPCLFEHPWPAVTSVLRFGGVLSPCGVPRPTPDARRERCCVSSPRRSRCRDHLAVARRPPRQSSLPTYGTPWRERGRSGARAGAIRRCRRTACFAQHHRHAPPSSAPTSATARSTNPVICLFTQDPPPAARATSPTDNRPNAAWPGRLVTLAGPRRLDSEGIAGLSGPRDGS